MRVAVAAVLLAAACSAPATSGIDGRVLAGPVCPVERVPPDPACADRPIAMDLVVIDARGATVAALRSGPAGRFHVSLAPGRYTLRSAGGRLPALRDTEVVVDANRFTEAELRADTGIR